MTLQDAADQLNIPKKRLWRAVKAGQVEAVQIQKGQRWEYRITADALEAYRQVLETEDPEWNDASQVVPTETERSDTSWSEVDHSVLTGTDRSGTWNDTVRNVSERSVTSHSKTGQTPSNGASVPSPPLGVYIELMDRLSRAERRSVELELALRQSQRLLTENAESISEKEALAAQVKAQLYHLFAVWLWTI